MRRTLALALCFIACAPQPEPPKPPITVFTAASLARPFATLSDSFRARSGVLARAELGGSLEHARKLTELGRVPDALMLVDDEVMAGLTPSYLDWYVRFATNRIVVAYTAKSRFADSITSENWWRILSRRDVTVGRADSAIAPAGRHALSVIRRAESYYGQPRLGARLLARMAVEHIRPNATELAALLETSNVDYILEYESVARQYGFRFVALPEDLALAVTYGISVPRGAAHFQEGVAFTAFVLSEEGKRILRDANVNVLDTPVAMGTGVPLDISQRVRTAATPSGR